MKLVVLFTILLVAFALLATADAARARLTKERISLLMHLTARSSVVVNNPGGGSSGIRTNALVALAMFEAVNSIEQKYEPYLVQFNEIPSNINVDGAHKIAAAAYAVRGILDHLYPGTFQQGLRYFHHDLQSILTESIDESGSEGGANSPTKIAQGKLLGQYVAQRLIANRTGDGWTEVQGRNPVVNGDEDGEYRYNLTFHGGLPQFTAYNVIPFGPLPYTDPLFFVPPPPQVDSAENIADFQATFGYGTSDITRRTRDSETDAVGLFHDGYFGSSTGWAGDVMTSGDRVNVDDVDLLRILALAGMSSHDSHAVHWKWKYTYLRWRPIQAFRLVSTRNPALAAYRDDNWSTLMPTGQNPEYPSGHSSRSSGYVTPWRLAFGDACNFKTLSFNSFNDERSFTSFTGFLDEVNRARVYIGLHFPSATVAGTDLGTNVGTWYFNNLLRPLA